METYRKVMDINYFGNVDLTQKLLPLLKQTRNSRIINISSIVGLFGGEYIAAYCGFFFKEFYL
jgi:NAD(P)-dependent dehydrogenase (short-subunit alcohol dehydrogenase family)